jgi:hypothetical protein
MIGDTGMKNLFEHTSAPWIRYSSYEYRTADDGTLYIVVSENAKPEMFRPMQDAEKLVLDAINIGLHSMHKVSEDVLREMVLKFVTTYGFLGFMTALPTTAEFVTYESVYLPKNHFIREETLSTEKYLSYFFPFEKLDFHKRGMESGWSISDNYGIAIAMAMRNSPQAVTMSFQKGYAEKYDWMIKEFTDWAFTFTTSFLYYHDYDEIDEPTRNLYRQGMSAFGGISPTYHIALNENAPVIVWDFHSLLVMIQMCFSFMLTSGDIDMKICKHCGMAFVASRKGNEFCSPQCKNRFNVYKSRDKKKDK